MNLKNIAVILISLIHFVSYGQNVDPYVHYDTTMEAGEVIQRVSLSTVFVFTNDRKGRVLKRKYDRLTNAVRVTYPIAKHAQSKLREMNRVLPSLSKEEQRKYVKEVEKELKVQYTPILKKMSMYQGVILLKLIDRETGSSSYGLVKEMRGGFSAFFWQGVARVFGANLKLEYDEKGDDKIIEELIKLYEAGLI